MLTGACIARAAGFPARARYATAACVVAAELPDADYVYRLGGPLVYFQHHRGWTHALWSLPLQAAFVVLIFWMVHHFHRRERKRYSGNEPAPERWFLLGLMALLALCSHILLDWTNNYGVRPFAPWNPHWYAGELVFIVEPLLLLFLSLALLLPLVFTLVQGEIGARRRPSNGRGLAVTALLLSALLWVYRSVQRSDTRPVIAQQEFRGGAPMRTSVDPYPIDPYRWHAVVETPTSFTGADVNSRTGAFDTSTETIYAKPAVSLATLAAKRSWLGHIYLDWSKFPLVTDAGTAAELHPEMDLSPAESAMRVVQFSDLRFRYDTFGMRGSAHPPLGAEAWVDANNEVVRIFIGTTEQRLR
jgi:inner membrane protein